MTSSTMQPASDDHAQGAQATILRRVHRALRLLSGFTETLHRVDDERALLSELCRQIVERGGYRLAWVGYAQHDAERSVVPMAQAGFEDGYLEAARITWADVERGRGPTGTAIRERRTVVIRDFATDPRATPWRAAALDRGYASALAIPVMVDDALLGALNLYAVEPDAFDVDELALLQELSSQLGYGVRTLRDRRARQVAEDELRRTLTAMRESEERYRALFDHSSSPTLILDPEDGQILAANWAAAEYYGWTREQLLQMKISQINTLPPEEVAGRMRHAVGQHAQRLEFRHRQADGSVRDVEVFAGPLPIGGRALLHAVIHDITEQKRLAREVEHHREHLEQLVRVRTEELAQAREHAEEANRGKSAFLANMSHEIRTPLNAIVGLTYLMQRAGLSPENAHRLSRIDDAGRHLLAVISDILDLSKIEAGKLELEPSSFQVSSMLDSVRSLVGGAASARGLDLRVECDPALDAARWLAGDPTRLRQALLNYASNAIKFTESGHVTLRARLIEKGDRDALVRFEVEDTGIGIAADKLPALFVPFGQADSSTTRKYGGTGLGLAISRRLAELMGGEAGVESELGRGSTFWFTGRFAPGQPLPTAARTPGLTASVGALRARHPGAKVLLAEDHPVNREVALELLAAAHLSVDVAENGRQAVELARANRYALVLMDMQMPEMDGLEATRELRRLAGWAEVPIVAMTANAFEADRDSCERAGMNDFLAKPVDPELLFRTLARWLPEQPDVHAPAPAAARVDLPFVDTIGGLARMGGDQEKYLQWLRRFATGQGENLSELRGSLEAQDWESARRRAHALKGAAATLGATQIAELAAAVERASRDRSPADPSWLPELGRLLDALDASLPPEQPLPSTGAAPPGEQPLARLEALLRESDAEAERFVAERESALRALLGDRFLELRHALARFDFDGALGLLTGERRAATP